MDEAKTYVRTDEYGVIRVGQTRVPLDSVVYSFRQGHSPESIQQQYPALSLEEVYGTIAYCLAHPTEIATYLHRQEEAWKLARDKSERQASPVVERLRAILPL